MVHPSRRFSRGANRFELQNKLSFLSVVFVSDDGETAIGGGEESNYYCYYFVPRTGHEVEIETGIDTDCNATQAARAWKRTCKKKKSLRQSYCFSLFVSIPPPPRKTNTLFSIWALNGFFFLFFFSQLFTRSPR